MTKLEDLTLRVQSTEEQANEEHIRAISPHARHVFLANAWGGLVAELLREIEERDKVLGKINDSIDYLALTIMDWAYLGLTPLDSTNGRLPV